MSQFEMQSSGRFRARRAIPRDVQETYASLYGARTAVTLSLPAGTPRATARRQLSGWTALIDERIKQIREQSVSAK
jgi:hypothetical protein